MKKFTKFVDKQVQKLGLSPEQHISQNTQPFPPHPYLPNQDPSQYYSNQYQYPPYPNTAFPNTLLINSVLQAYPNPYYPPYNTQTSTTYPYPPNQYHHLPATLQNVLSSNYPTPPSSSNPISQGYPSHTNTHQTHPNLVSPPPNQSISHMNQSNHPSSSAATTAPAGYPSSNNNSSAPSSLPQGNESLPSPPSTYNLPQSLGANHSIPSTPVQTPINNNSVYSTPSVTPTHPNFPSSVTTAQPHTTPPPGTHPHLEQHIPQQQPSQFPNDHNPSVDPNPAPIEHVPNHIIYGKRLLDDETIQQAITRIHSARVALGDTATADARKGLSRRIQTGNLNDVELFRHQLKNSQIDACELNYENFTDKVLCIAVSYVHCKHPIGRFKFSPEQWNSLKVALANLFHFNVTEVRLWLDQCLWIRDVSQESWAHTGLVPYVIWPVISLGVKRYKHDRTTASFSRMWPFVEELAGLWSMGLMITKEMRSGNAESGNRSVLSYNLRHRLEPEDSMDLLLKNIYHGAADDHETGWQEDVEELKEMARLNLSSGIKGIAIGSDWRSKVAQAEPKALYLLLTELQLSCVHPFFGGEDVEGLKGMGRLNLSSGIGGTANGSAWLSKIARGESNNLYGILSDFQLTQIDKFLSGTNTYLEGSRCIVKGSDGGWDGITEWMSGNKGMVPFSYIDKMTAEMLGMTKFNILTDKGEFQILGKSSINSGLWLLVVMDGRSSRFSRGRVAWTKVIHGENSCHLSAALTGKKTWVVEHVLREQTNVICNVTHMECVNNLPIEWT